VAWGWALSQSSTWLEVFDPRWEAVHSWGGCPTWQLSRFCLGLAPRFELGARYFEVDLHVGSSAAAGLGGARGNVPARDGDAVAVSWARVPATPSYPAGQVKYTLAVKAAIFVLGWPTSPTTWVKIEGEQTAVFAEQDVV